MVLVAVPVVKALLVGLFVWLLSLLFGWTTVLGLGLYASVFAVLASVAVDQLVRRLPVGRFKPSVPLHEWPKSCALVRVFDLFFKN